MSEEDATLFREVSPDQEPTPWSEDRNTGPYLEMAPQAERVSLGMKVLTAEATAIDIENAEPNIRDAAQPETIQDTKLAEEICTLRAEEAAIEDTTTQIPPHHQVTLGTQRDAVCETSERETFETTTTQSPSPASEPVSQMRGQILVPATCPCGRAILSHETYTMPEATPGPQQTTISTEEYLNPRSGKGVSKMIKGESLGPKWKPLEVIAPTSPIEPLLIGITQPRRKGRKETNLETPAEAVHQANEVSWTALTFIKATWRSMYRVRAVTSANNVDPRVQEVLDLPVLNLATVQDEDPDLRFMKELLGNHDDRSPWNTVRKESAEVNILWTQFHLLKIQENVLYHRREGNYRKPAMASGGPQASQIADFQGLPPSCYGRPSRGSEDCCLDKDTFLLAKSEEGCRECGIKDVPLADAARPPHETTVNYNSPDIALSMRECL